MTRDGTSYSCRSSSRNFYLCLSFGFLFSVHIIDAIYVNHSRYIPVSLLCFLSQCPDIAYQYIIDLIACNTNENKQTDFRLTYTHRNIRIVHKCHLFQNLQNFIKFCCLLFNFCFALFYPIISLIIVKVYYESIECWNNSNQIKKLFTTFVQESTNLLKLNVYGKFVYTSQNIPKRALSMRNE